MDIRLAAYAVMRVTGTETVPGVWPTVSVLGVAMGIAVAPILAGLPLVGRGLQALGVRTLPIYLLHMPLLALAGLVTLAVFLPLAALVAALDGSLVALWWAFGAFMVARLVTLLNRERGDAWLVTGFAPR